MVPTLQPVGGSRVRVSKSETLRPRPVTRPRSRRTNPGFDRRFFFPSFPVERLFSPPGAKSDGWGDRSGCRFTPAPTRDSAYSAHAGPGPVCSVPGVLDWGRASASTAVVWAAVSAVASGSGGVFGDGAGLQSSGVWNERGSWQWILHCIHDSSHNLVRSQFTSVEGRGFKYGARRRRRRRMILRDGNYESSFAVDVGFEGDASPFTSVEACCKMSMCGRGRSTSTGSGLKHCRHRGS